VRGYKGKELLFRADGYDQAHVGGTRPGVTHTLHPPDEWNMLFDTAKPGQTTNSSCRLSEVSLSKPCRSAAS
jgi:hypothetical protein